jgi:hypothetical protein
VLAGHGPSAANGLGADKSLPKSLLRRSISNHLLRFEPLWIGESRPVLGQPDKLSVGITAHVYGCSRNDRLSRRRTWDEVLAVSSTSADGLAVQMATVRCDSMHLLSVGETSPIECDVEDQMVSASPSRSSQACGGASGLRRASPSMGSCQSCRPVRTYYFRISARNMVILMECRSEHPAS